MTIFIPLKSEYTCGTKKDTSTGLRDAVQREYDSKAYFEISLALRNFSGIFAARHISVRDAETQTLVSPVLMSICACRNPKLNSVVGKQNENQVDGGLSSLAVGRGRHRILRRYYIYAKERLFNKILTIKRRYHHKVLIQYLALEGAARPSDFMVTQLTAKSIAIKSNRPEALKKIVISNKFRLITC